MSNNSLDRLDDIIQHQLCNVKNQVIDQREFINAVNMFSAKKDTDAFKNLVERIMERHFTSRKDADTADNLIHNCEK